jgi:hypothetical protein
MMPAVLALLTTGTALALAASGPAREIRVLLLAPKSSGVALRVRVDKLEEAITQARGQLRLVDSLSDAEVIVEFTDYARVQGSGGEMECHWTGQFKALVPKDPRATERFVLLLRGAKAADVNQATPTLANVLARALGRQGQRTESEDVGGIATGWS